MNEIKVIVVYESFFGNTSQIAEAISDSIPDSVLKPASDISADELSDYNLIIAGSPTRGFRPTEHLSNLIKKLSENALTGISVVAFDTRINLVAIKQKIWRKMVHAGGYAAPVIHKRLVKKGAIPLCEPEGFYVMDTEGPLQKGELQRAREWGLKIVEICGSGLTT